MARIPARGVSTVIVPWGLERLDVILERLREKHGIELNLSDDDKKALIQRIGFIQGRYFQEKDRLDAPDIVNKINSVRSSLESVIKVLSVFEGGSHHGDDIETAIQIADAFRHHKELVEISEAHERLGYLVEISRDVCAACEISANKLRNIQGKSGPSRYVWYDNFTELLVALAKVAGIKPVVVTNRTNLERTGPFIELALAFESLLFDDPSAPKPIMPSPTRAACAKRLERSLKRLSSR